MSDHDVKYRGKLTSLAHWNSAYSVANFYRQKRSFFVCLPAFVGVLQLNTLDSPRGIPRKHSLRVPVEQNRTIEVAFTKRQNLYANKAWLSGNCFLITNTNIVLSTRRTVTSPAPVFSSVSSICIILDSALPAKQVERSHLYWLVEKKRSAKINILLKVLEW